MLGDNSSGEVWGVEIDAEGYFIVDAIEGALPYWWPVAPPNGMYRARLINGAWVETGSPPPLTLGEAQAQLETLARLADFQLAAMQRRVSNLEWLINEQDPEDPDYIEPNAEELADLAVRKAQMKSWNAYTTKLSRVKDQGTWPGSPAWPAPPAIYLDDPSLLSVIMQPEQSSDGI
ncbi:hypothetical protein LCG56_27015 [Pseudomonas cannabina pv. alisalensis]|uniref:Tail fiber assembly protein n=1 Tax=Pseudomonas syringae pv. maculicola str. ES4326 TaxID=629265 RepID=A0A8T8C032_PSEYM|nr:MULTISPECIES: hypothetical protein [Pseudomonas syringae group]QHE96879.1 hypothetical protein PMA4326_009735 [Pseudomonas syringae pv. maculicola str. ES4326]UBY97538.1 hypothetical protein LCG56_27015 [Pseudomonas cannabina pv. alisalensis]